MEKKLPLLSLAAVATAVAAGLALICSASPVAFTPCRGQEPASLPSEVSGLIPTNEPVVDVSEILSGPPFAAVVKNCLVTKVPASRNRDPMEVVVIDIKRDDGQCFRRRRRTGHHRPRSMPRKRLAPGHTYDFPEALEASA